MSRRAKDNNQNTYSNQQLIEKNMTSSPGKKQLINQKKRLRHNNDKQ